MAWSVGFEKKICINIIILRQLYAKVFEAKTFFFKFSSILKDLLLEFLFHIVIQFVSYESCSYSIKLSTIRWPCSSGYTLLKKLHIFYFIIPIQHLSHKSKIVNLTFFLYREVCRYIKYKEIEAVKESVDMLNKYKEQKRDEVEDDWNWTKFCCLTSIYR